jgi:hypothetical protein
VVFIEIPCRANDGGAGGAGSNVRGVSAVCICVCVIFFLCLSTRVCLVGCLLDGAY